MDGKEEFAFMFGEFIKYKRMEDNLTLKDLAERINIDFQNVHRLEKGKTSPSAYSLFRLAKAFNMHWVDFMTEFDSFVMMKRKELGRDLDAPIDNEPRGWD